MPEIDPKTFRLVVAFGSCLVGITWKLFFEWLRHRSYRKHIRTGFAPGTQHLAWIGALGFLFFSGAGLVSVYFLK